MISDNFRKWQCTSLLKMCTFTTNGFHQALQLPNILVCGERTHIKRGALGDLHSRILVQHHRVTGVSSLDCFFDTPRHLQQMRFMKDPSADTSYTSSPQTRYRYGWSNLGPK